MVDLRSSLLRWQGDTFDEVIFVGIKEPLGRKIDHELSNCALEPGGPEQGDKYQQGEQVPEHAKERFE